MSDRGTKRTADMMSEDSQPVTEYLESALDILPPLSVLGAALRSGIIILPDSPNRNILDDTGSFILVGHGRTSSVLQRPGRQKVVKKRHPHYGIVDSFESVVVKETEMTMEVHQVFDTYESGSNISIKVPGNARAIMDCSALLNASNHRHSLPPPFSVFTLAIEMDMICPLPKAVGRALIQQFHPKLAGSTLDPYVVEEILNRNANQHCLVQPCLGLDTLSREPGDFSLHDFELSLSDMRNIGMDSSGLTQAIGQAFSLLHYRCWLNGKGVQFAFGTSLSRKPCISILSYTVHLYLFDFGDCERITSREDTHTLSRDIVNEMLKPNVRKFIPSPLKSPMLFKIFKDAYIDHATKALDNKCNTTPHIVMEHYERRAAREFL